MKPVSGDVIRGVLVYVTLPLRAWGKPRVAVYFVETKQRKRKRTIKIHRRRRGEMLTQRHAYNYFLLHKVYYGSLMSITLIRVSLEGRIDG